MRFLSEVQVEQISFSRHPSTWQDTFEPQTGNGSCLFWPEASVACNWHEQKIPSWHFRDGKDRRMALETVREFLGTVFLGFMLALYIDCQFSFAFYRFRDLADEKVWTCVLKDRDNKSPGKGERYHESLRRVISSIRTATNSIDTEKALTFFLKSIKDTMGQKRLMQ